MLKPPGDNPSFFDLRHGDCLELLKSLPDGSVNLVLTYGRDRPSLHPTAKPDLLLRHLIRSYSHAGDLVLDPFAGCGSSLVAALREGRRAVGMEMDAEYFVVAERRLTEIRCGTLLPVAAESAL